MNGRELTKKEKSMIGKLVNKYCASFDEEYGCLPIDGECYMKTIGFTDSPLCRYFQRSVLPLDAQVQKIFYGGNVETCKYCGTSFFRGEKRVYCSDKCALLAHRKQVKDATRKYRNRKGESVNISPLESLDL